MANEVRNNYAREVYYIEIPESKTALPSGEDGRQFKENPELGGDFRVCRFNYATGSGTSSLVSVFAGMKIPITPLRPTVITIL